MFRSESMKALRLAKNLNVLILVVVDVPFGAEAVILFDQKAEVLILVVVDVPFGALHVSWVVT